MTGPVGHPLLFGLLVEEPVRANYAPPLIFIDIAVPRDADPALDELTGVIRHDIDDLQATLDANMQQRAAAIPDVRAIIVEELQSLDEWLQGRQIVPVITKIKQKAKNVAQLEVAEALRKLGPEVDDGTQAIIERMAHRLINKMLHEPVVQLKAQAAEGNGTVYANTLHELFCLEDVAVEPPKRKQKQVITLEGTELLVPTIEMPRPVEQPALEPVHA